MSIRVQVPDICLSEHKKYHKLPNIDELITCSEARRMARIFQLDEAN
jgi:hypothetical protein